MNIKTNKTQWVQDTCRALKPILGKRVERIWQTYLFQDEDGKEELEQHIQLLADSMLHTDVENVTPVFLPPRPDHARGQFGLGSVYYNAKALHEFGLRPSELFQHTAIFGRSGAGKTNLGFLFVRRLAEQGVPFLVLDWKRNFRDLMPLPGFDKMEVYTIGRPVAPFRFNPLIPPAGVLPRAWLKKLIEVMAHAFFLGDGSMYLLQNTIDHVYRRAGVYKGDVTQYPTFRDVLKTLQSIPARGRELLWLSSCLRAVATLCFGQIDLIINTRQNQQLNDLFQKQAVFEMESLSQSDKVFFAESLLLWLHMAKLAASGPREKLSNVVVIEEAHHIVSKRARRNSSAGESIMDTIFRELREFGVGLCILDQHPSEISLTALGNTYATICMNLKSSADVSAMAGAMLLDEDQKLLLGNMEVGKAVVKLQGRIPEPFLIHVPLVPVVKGAVTDDMVAERMKPFAPLADEAFSEPLSQIESAFLRDVVQFPDSGVVARYRRLGLSNRAGDVLKRELLGRGLITEREQTTPKGRTNAISLTPDGTKWLAAP